MNSPEKNWELISCICPTYGRIPTHLHLLEESVYWFTQQTYPNKELIILNDCPTQKVFCNVPNVRTINLPNRFATLGEKYNALVKETKGTIIVPWEDDDISLPGRLSQAEEKLRDGGEYFNPQRSWYEASGKLHSDHKHGVCHNASAYRRLLFDRINGYSDISGAQDLDFDRRCKQHGMVVDPVNDIKDWHYIYRWGVSPVHLSGARDMQAFYDGVKVTDGFNIAFIRPIRHKDYSTLVSVLVGDAEECGSGKCKKKCGRSTNV